jgi:hypothetical protein
MNDSAAPVPETFVPIQRESRPAPSVLLREKIATCADVS